MVGTKLNKKSSSSKRSKSGDFDIDIQIMPLLRLDGEKERSHTCQGSGQCSRSCNCISTDDC